MNLLTNIQINSICWEVAHSFHLYGEHLSLCAQVQYYTGCRANDALQFNRWSLLANGNVLLQPQKNNLIRTFIPTDLPPKFYSYLAENYNPFVGLLYGKYQYYVGLSLRKYSPTVGQKGVLSHLFRHNYAKKLKNLGMLDVDICQKMGEKQQVSANMYIYSQVFGYY